MNPDTVTTILGWLGGAAFALAEVLPPKYAPWARIAGAALLGALGQKAAGVPGTPKEPPK